MREVQPLLSCVKVLLGKFLHLNTFLPHAGFLFCDNFREGIVFNGVPDAVHPQVSVLLTGGGHPATQTHEQMF